ncbi:UDP-glucose 6-dehydrogenase [Echinococcus granulosus]|uniref:UDP-glucose 6-dehydrogenase n=1 Tax=Echinococcus granulosus TaxID=6210 RepID=U6JJH8_ECHGR|nr:UDP-glucose 6-dehydrogenase [Echinococcus granulosus]EUB58782.1 UDP-glucose 6-dehydrogenase [Echinococcus granulosus]KAH9283489.1 UDP-glucose 6-dehydrogenase [Echinococcus granulosus]CDS24256.1 UDP glucose 6 dehydrogenase [Echinococcus granulosus]
MVGKKYKICGVGAGILGVPVCAVIASKCPEYSVSVVDCDRDIINQWNNGPDYPISEVGLDDLLKQCNGKNFIISSEADAYLADADIILICVKTPAKSLGVGRGRAADLGSIEAVSRQIVASGNSSAIVVVQSTVPIGATDLINSIFSANKKQPSKLIVLSNPQFVSEGSVIENLLHPDRVVLGGEADAVSRKATNVISSIYERWVPKEKILTMSTKSAEVTKLVTNAFLAQRVSSINAISSVCEETAADVRQVADAVGRDTRVGGHFLDAGLGFGGNTLPPDLHHLVYTCESLELPIVAAFWNAVLTVNEFQVSRFFRKITAHYCETLRDKRLALLGCAFKKGTPDVKNSPAIMICCRLLLEDSTIAVYDPLAKKEFLVDAITDILGQKPANIDNLIWCATPMEAAENADGIIVCTDCDEFKTLDYNALYQTMRKPASFFDGRLVAPHRELQEIGFRVEALGVRLK